MIKLRRRDSMRLKQRLKEGQTLLEFVVLFIVLAGALFAMQKYVQRGVQGKWKESIEGMGKQYDPAGNSITTYSTNSTAETDVDLVYDPSTGNYHTLRTDTLNMIEDKTEQMNIHGL